MSDGITLKVTIEGEVKPQGVMLADLDANALYLAKRWKTAGMPPSYERSIFFRGIHGEARLGQRGGVQTYGHYILYNPVKVTNVDLKGLE